MARLRFLAVALLALALAGNSTQTGRTQSAGTYSGSYTAMSKPAAVDHSCVIYSLTEMGYDADLGKWIAQTIPEMIEPSSWQQQGGSGVVRYFAPKNILIVKQSPALQRKVDGFIKEVKTSLPKASATSFGSSSHPKASVVPADYREPALLRTSQHVPEPSSYPVPAAVKPPKHLFHFIIRYEGDGIIDDNVVKFMKTQLQGAKSPVGVGILSTVPSAPPMPPPAGAPPVSENVPTPNSGYYGSAPASPYSAPIPGTTASASPYSAPTPSMTTPQPSNAPKKKKGKKDDNKEKKIPTVVP